MDEEEKGSERDLWWGKEGGQSETKAREIAREKLIVPGMTAENFEI